MSMTKNTKNTRDAKDTETAAEQNAPRQVAARSKKSELPTSIKGPGGDYEPPTTTTKPAAPTK
jgi:hypothetical protein